MKEPKMQLFAIQENCTAYNTALIHNVSTLAITVNSMKDLLE